MSDITKRSEKIASAIYLITGFFNNQEPLKWKLRDIASELTSIGVFLRDNFSQDRNKLVADLNSIVFEAKSFLSVARNAGLVSDTNFSIMDNELTNYLNSVDFPIGITASKGQLMLSSRFFDREEVSPDDVKSENMESSNDVLKDKISSEERRNKGFPTHDNSPKEYLPQLKSLNLKEFGVVSAKKSNRQSIIISLLKRKKEIMIKDVFPLIKGCSEKTIQRELLSMVQSGVLKKVGEKRWSRYTLA